MTMKNFFRETSSKDWKNDFHTIWALTRQHLPRLIVAVLCSLVLSAINGGIAWLVKPSLDSLFVEKNRTILFLLPAGVFLLFVFKGLFAFLNNFLMSSIGAKIVKTLRQALYNKLLSLPISFFSKKSSGSIISRVLNDIGSLESLIANTARNFFVQSTTIIVLAIVALLRRWDLALLSFTIIPIVVIVADGFGKRMKKTSKKTREFISDVTKLVQETVLGIRVIKAFTMEEKMRNRNDEAVSRHYRNVMREVRIREFTAVSMEVIAGAGIAIILWYGSYLIINNKLSVGSFFSFITAILMIYTPLKRLSQVNNNFQMIRTALHRVKEIFLLEDEVAGGIDKAEIEGHIVYDNVSFHYPDSNEPALKDVNLEIQPGETIAIVGYSGAGKSTLIDLILGFWKDYTGRIMIDGTDIRDYSLKGIRSHIGVVSQDIILFDDTVKNNILFGRPDAPEAEVVEAATAAYAHDFIMDMPHGYDTYIGERGVKLSGGQKQRISLARAILKNPKILILDEATSSLDADSEAKIQKALESIMPGRTTLIIAHRLSTINKADRIIVMERGRIIQKGSHEELFSSSGVYQELYSAHRHD
ncbi:MAG TPA: ABC transporter ATP-binding protein [Nitrospirae bacterium]|nr:ABC transporter ATP-binding protein [Nitrospirota bacterium]